MTHLCTTRNPMSEAPIWLPVLGYEGRYEVSDQGDVRNAVTKTVLRPTSGRDGYLTVGLYVAGGWRQHKRRLIHNLVCEAFHGPRPPKMHAAHIDGQNTNNTPGNLAWVTPRENCAHKILHGTAIRGERSKNAILTDALVRQIWNSPLLPGALAKQLGLNAHTIEGVRSGKSWRHVTAHLPAQPFRGNQGKELTPSREAIDLLSTGLSKRKVATQVGVSTSTVCKWAKQLAREPVT